jgi:hypothetical protein
VDTLADKPAGSVIGVTLSWPAPSGGRVRRYTEAALLALWLCGWAAAWVLGAGQLANGGPHPAHPRVPPSLVLWFLIAWLGFWTMFGGVALWNLWTYFRPARPESVRLGSDGLRYDPGRSPSDPRQQRWWGGGHPAGPRPTRVRPGAGRGAAAAVPRPRRRPAGDRRGAAGAGAGVAVRGPAEVAHAEPGAAPDRGGMERFRGSMPHRPPRQVSVSFGRRGEDVTKAEWQTCVDPLRMLASLEGHVTTRQLRLFACACCRRIWHLIGDPRSREAVEVAERLADGLVTKEERDRALLAACDAFQEADPDTAYEEPVADMTSILLCPDVADEQHPFPFDARRVAELAADMAGSEGSYRAGDDLDGTGYRQGRAAEELAQCQLLRDIVGSLFRSS